MSTFSNLDKQQLAAIVTCRRAELRPLVQLFETTLASTMNALVTATDPVTIHRMQGKAQVFKDFLELLEKADQILERQR